jgi:hypothetical protein
MPTGSEENNWACTASQLHHDNALSHTSILTQQFLAKYKMAVIPHPPQSPYLAPCDIGRRFDNNEAIQTESQRVVDTDRKGLPGSVPKM